MINRIFNSYKYHRTYIGGSIENEYKAFKSVEGIKEDGSDIDLIELNRLIRIRYDDILRVILSWKELTFKISLSVLILGLILINGLFFNIPIISLILFGLSIILFIIHLNLKRKEFNYLRTYEFCLNIVLLEIEKRFGLKLEK